MSATTVKEVACEFREEELKHNTKVSKLISAFEDTNVNDYETQMKIILTAEIKKLQTDMPKSSMPPLTDSVTCPVNADEIRQYKKITRAEIDQLRSMFVDQAIKEIDWKIRTPLKQVEYECGNHNALADSIMAHYEELGCITSQYHNNSGVVVIIQIL